MSLRRLAAAALCLAAAVALSAATPDGGSTANPWPWALPDTGFPFQQGWRWGPPDAAAPGLDASGPPDTGPTGLCAPQRARFERRRAWLAARREEQFALGGPPNLKLGVRNAVHIFCQANPGDEDCALYNVTVTVKAEELVWTPDAGVDDFEPHLVVMRRALNECLESAKKAAAPQ